jgi:hypothetical protein
MKLITSLVEIVSSLIMQIGGQSHVRKATLNETNDKKMRMMNGIECIQAVSFSTLIEDGDHAALTCQRIAMVRIPATTITGGFVPPPLAGEKPSIANPTRLLTIKLDFVMILLSELAPHLFECDMSFLSNKNQQRKEGEKSNKRASLREQHSK